MPIIRIQNLNNKDSEFNYFSGEVDSRYIINNDDLLFSWSGSKGTSFGPHIWDGNTAILNQHIFKVEHPTNINRLYLYLALKKIVTEVENNLHGGVGLVHITKGNLEKIKIPIPPLSVQQEIAAEIDGYQKIIDGAKQIVESYKPRIKGDEKWPMVEFNRVCTLEYGNSLPEKNRITGEYPVVGSNGITGWHKEYLIDGPAIIIGRKGSAGEVVWIDKPCFPIDTTYYIKRMNETNIDLKFLYFVLKSLGLTELRGGGAVPGLNRNDVYRTKKIPLPPLKVQKQIVAEIEEEQKLVEANKKLIEIFEDKIKAKIAEVWGYETPTDNTAELPMAAETMAKYES